MSNEKWILIYDEIRRGKVRWKMTVYWHNKAKGWVGQMKLNDPTKEMIVWNDKDSAIQKRLELVKTWGEKEFPNLRIMRLDEAKAKFMDKEKEKETDNAN